MSFHDFHITIPPELQELAGATGHNLTARQLRRLARRQRRKEAGARMEEKDHDQPRSRKQRRKRR